MHTSMPFCQLQDDRESAIVNEFHLLSGVLIEHTGRNLKSIMHARTPS